MNNKYNNLNESVKLKRKLFSIGICSSIDPRSLKGDVESTEPKGLREKEDLRGYLVKYQCIL